MMNFWRNKKKDNDIKQSPYLFVGLGTPGNKYLNTRHNVGFCAIDFFAQKHNIKARKIKCKSLVGEKTLFGKKIVIAKPQLFMNRSGESLRELIGSYKVEFEKVFVIYDDIDFETGVVRIRKKGSSGTHNGMKDIIYQLKRDDFPRIRIGIGKPIGKMDLVNYVLGNFDNKEEKIIQNTLKDIADIIEMIIKDGLDITMNRYNKKYD
jgi:PTH1 family peptidyl-tRNA hydrolase